MVLKEFNRGKKWRDDFYITCRFLTKLCVRTERTMGLQNVTVDSPVFLEMPVTIVLNKWGCCGYNCITAKQLECIVVLWRSLATFFFFLSFFFFFFFFAKASCNMFSSKYADSSWFNGWFMAHHILQIRQWWDPVHSMIPVYKLWQTL